ncbi:hypothetical protein HYDPIDRAFT_168372 [Hydnomerulius pinastri MD-312]|uniref:C3H1-type domain-containing protein n=1 Tax=Hydnomerulius pinastri MD-312 TaxID=994086 RepID=A0A0C9WEQ1_9AGAM|nr:hypothetical protein HYDPIDRAFT_168372 [Hydnomerulius pinastri MD-312]
MPSKTCFQFAGSGQCSFGAQCKYAHARGESRGARTKGNRRKTGGKQKIARGGPLVGITPLDEFFAGYPEFGYDPSKSASLEFYRMCDEFGWDRDDSVRVEVHQKFKDALVLQFNCFYGSDENNLEAWKDLCQIVNIYPVPDDLEECREAVRNTHVNIVDLVDTKATGERVQVFRSELELSVYTKATGKIFPRENAYQGGLLRYLLRHIVHPRAEGSYTSRKRRRY